MYIVQHTGLSAYSSSLAALARLFISPLHIASIPGS